MEVSDTLALAGIRDHNIQYLESMFYRFESLPYPILMQSSHRYPPPPTHSPAAASNTPCRQVIGMQFWAMLYTMTAVARSQRSNLVRSTGIKSNPMRGGCSSYTMIVSIRSWSMLHAEFDASSTIVEKAINKNVFGNFDIMPSCFRYGALAGADFQSQLAEFVAPNQSPDLPFCNLA